MSDLPALCDRCQTKASCLYCDRCTNDACDLYSPDCDRATNPIRYGTEFHHRGSDLSIRVIQANGFAELAKTEGAPNEIHKCQSTNEGMKREFWATEDHLRCEFHQEKLVCPRCKKDCFKCAMQDDDSYYLWWDCPCADYGSDPDNSVIQSPFEGVPTIQELIANGYKIIPNGKGTPFTPIESSQDETRATNQASIQTRRKPYERPSIVSFEMGDE